jgi:hypothetical protein
MNQTSPLERKISPTGSSATGSPMVAVGHSHHRRVGSATGPQGRPANTRAAAKAQGTARQLPEARTAGKAGFGRRETTAAAHLSCETLSVLARKLEP